jgi:hypothetical protein
MELEFATGLIEFEAAAVTFGAAAIPLFQKTTELPARQFIAGIGAAHG